MLIKESRNLCSFLLIASFFRLLSGQFSCPGSAFSHVAQRKVPLPCSCHLDQQRKSQAAASLPSARKTDTGSTRLCWPRGKDTFQSSGMSRQCRAVAPPTHPTICLLAGGGDKSIQANDKAKHNFSYSSYVDVWQQHSSGQPLQILSARKVIRR